MKLAGKGAYDLVGGAPDRAELTTILTLLCYLTLMMGIE